MSYSAVTELIESVKIVTQLGETFTAGFPVGGSTEKTYYFTNQHQLSGLRSVSNPSSSRLAAMGVIILDTTCAGWAEPSSETN